MITVTARNIPQLDGAHNTLTFVPFTGPDPTPGSAATAASFTRGTQQAIITWQCGGAGTTIPGRYLPAPCR